MTIMDLRNVLKGKVKPVYQVRVGDKFWLSRDGTFGHFCIYAKVNDRCVECEHGQSSVDSKQLVYPV